MTSEQYVHGYTEKESSRLLTQAGTLNDLLHGGTRYGAGSEVLEAGCGVGGQTVILAKNSPAARFTSVDRSPESLAEAQARLQGEGFTNVRFQLADLMHLEFADGTFDHVFVCFVLEHLPDPVAALRELKRVLKKGGTLTAIEGDHGSFYCHPQTEEAMLTVHCLIRSQAALGGNALIGRELYPLLRRAGFGEVAVEPKIVYSWIRAAPSGSRAFPRARLSPWSKASATGPWPRA